MPGGGRWSRRWRGHNMNMGRLYGKIVESKTNKAIDAASVQLVQSKFDTVTKKRKDVIIDGNAYQGKSGNFSLENLPLLGQFQIENFWLLVIRPLEQKVGFEMKMGQGGI